VTTPPTVYAVFTDPMTEGDYTKVSMEIAHLQHSTYRMMEILHKVLGALDGIEARRVIAIENHASPCHEAAEPKVEAL
jgi:hypothetical protein